VPVLNPQDRYYSQVNHILGQHVDEYDSEDDQKGEVDYDVLDDGTEHLLSDAEVAG